MEPLLRSFSAAVDDVNSKEKSIVAKVSVGVVDRYNTLIECRGIDIKDYQACPVVLFEHGRDVTRGALPVGKNLWIRLDKSGVGKLIAKTKFRDDDFSQALWEMYSDGTMRGWSVSILPTDFGPPKAEEVRQRPELKDCETVYRRSTLAEYSAVSVPGCQAALSDEDIRSLTRVVARGIPVPIDIKALVEKAMTESGGLASGGALVKPDDTEDKSGACCDDKTKKRATDADDDDNEDDDKDDDDKDEVKEGITITGGGIAVVGMNADETETVERTAPEPDVEPEPVIELPPLTGRSFTQIFHEMRLAVLDHEHRMAQKIQDYIDWQQGKA